MLADCVGLGCTAGQAYRFNNTAIPLEGRWTSVSHRGRLASKKMQRIVLILIGSVALAVIASTTPAPAASDNQIERGKYLVMHVAMCVQCHTPRDEQGELDESQLLQGAPMPINSPFSSQIWAFETPKIAGLPAGWTEEDLIHFLQTGKDPRGESPQPPMPPFRMTKEDATAIAMYLKSLQ